MRRGRVAGAAAVAWVTLSVAGSGCRPTDASAERIDTAKLAQRRIRVEQAFGRTDSAIARWVLPRELDEISGIALTPDGRLLAHGDERAQ
ncbi:MAG TPA: hypothetical protein VFZ21_15870, partial [Gemmatimonadaceae bacterium]|nr:hypothetical protein [Gemmatimonadaceae bacterium]